MHFRINIISATFSENYHIIKLYYQILIINSIKLNINNIVQFL